MPSVSFNVAGCGVALPLQVGNRLYTTGVISCVVLQVLSDNHVFAAHLTEPDTEDNSQLSEFCTNIRLQFESRNSNIIGCTLWYSVDKKSLPHAMRIVSTIENNLDSRIKLEQLRDGTAELIVNSRREVDVVPYVISGQSIHLVPGDKFDSDTRANRENVVFEGLKNYGYNNGFAVGIYEGMDLENFEFENENEFLNQREDEENNEPRGFFSRICRWCC